MLVSSLLHVYLKYFEIFLVKTIKKGFNWLGGRVALCNKEIGTPFQRCYKIANKALSDCREKMGKLKFLCNVTKIMHGLCYSVKFIDVICIIIDFISDKIVHAVEESKFDLNI